MLFLTPQNSSLLTDMQVKDSLWISVSIQNSLIPRDCLKLLEAKEKEWLMWVCRPTKLNVSHKSNRKQGTQFHF